MTYSTRTVLTVCCVMLSSVALAQTQVPNDFQAGSAARAADVYANFDALEAVGFAVRIRASTHLTRETRAP